MLSKAIDYKEQEKGIMESIYNTIQKDDNLKRKYECIISIKGLGKVVIPFHKNKNNT